MKATAQTLNGPVVADKSRVAVFCELTYGNSLPRFGPYKQSTPHFASMPNRAAENYHRLFAGGFVVGDNDRIS